jgi:hypothetical protein
MENVEPCNEDNTTEEASSKSTDDFVSSKYVGMSDMTDAHWGIGWSSKKLNDYKFAEEDADSEKDKLTNQFRTAEEQRELFLWMYPEVKNAEVTKMLNVSVLTVQCRLIVHNCTVLHVKQINSNLKLPTRVGVGNWSCARRC